MDNKRVLSIKEAIEKYGNSKGWWQKKLKDGDIKGNCIGGSKWMIPVGNIERYFKGESKQDSDLETRRDEMELKKLELEVKKTEAELDGRLMETDEIIKAREQIASDGKALERKERALESREGELITNRQQLTQRESELNMREQSIGKEYDRLAELWDIVNDALKGVAKKIAGIETKAGGIVENMEAELSLFHAKSVSLERAKSELTKELEAARQGFYLLPVDRDIPRFIERVLKRCGNNGLSLMDAIKAEQENTHTNIILIKAK